MVSLNMSDDKENSDKHEDHEKVGNEISYIVHCGWCKLFHKQFLVEVWPWEDAIDKAFTKVFLSEKLINGNVQACIVHVFFAALFIIFASSFKMVVCMFILNLFDDRSKLLATAIIQTMEII